MFKRLLPEADGLTSARVSASPVISGTERDEIAAIVGRIKRADQMARQPRHAAPHTAAHVAVSDQDLKWAEDWQLPKEVFDYFILERAA